MNLQEELKSLKERITELEELTKEEQEFPQEGDLYWFIDDEGSVCSTVYDNHYIDRYHQLIGNFFQTDEQAEFTVEKLKVEAELRKFSRPFECGEINRYIFLDTNSECLDVAGLSYSQYQGTIYFESEEKAKLAIEAVGEERISKYIFGVEG